MGTTASPSAPLRLVTAADADAGPPAIADRAASLQARWAALTRAGAPDAELVRVAFDHCHEMVFATASRIVGNPWEAEDVAQSVFETLVRRLQHLRDPASLPGFLKTCAVRMALRLVKRQRWRRRRLQVMGPVAIPDDAPARVALVRQLLAQLDDEERVAIVLKCVEGHPFHEIAEMMDVSVPTARRRVASARAKLVAILGGDGMIAIFGGEDGP